MANEAAGWLITNRDGVYWDATVGAAGHAREIISRLDDRGRLVVSDRDPGALELARSALAGQNVVAVLARFSELEREWREAGVGPVSGVLFDFGIGSFQLDAAERGLSFDLEGPLDMRLGPGGEPVRVWLNHAPEHEIASVIADLGEERRARPIARAIVQARPLATTTDLRRAITAATPPAGRTKTLARVFQAFRIRTNDELSEIDSGLAAMRTMLAPGGRVVAISYHSLEDRRVKQFFRQESRDCLCPADCPECRCGHRAWLSVLTRHAEVPGDEEVRVNPRSRSARLRAAERIDPL
jgi:16S rRNA (cytosine1402-N4)-methyltransferase